MPSVQQRLGGRVLVGSDYDRRGRWELSGALEVNQSGARRETKPSNQISALPAGVKASQSFRLARRPTALINE